MPGAANNVAPGIINRAGGKSAAPAPAAADSGQVQSQQSQTDKEQAGWVENGTDGRASGIDDKRDRKKNGRDYGEQGSVLPVSRQPGAPDRKHEVIRYAGGRRLSL